MEIDTNILKILMRVNQIMLIISILMCVTCILDISNTKRENDTSEEAKLAIEREYNIAKHCCHISFFSTVALTAIILLNT